MTAAESRPPPRAEAAAPESARAAPPLLLAINPSVLSELRDRGLLAYHLNDHTAALRDLETYLKFAPRGGDREESRNERTEIWGHVKALRRRVASLN